MSSEQSLQLGDITDDLVRLLEVVGELRSIDGSATYETVRQATTGEFHLHLLSYVRFLESASLLTYDRISDEMEVTSEGEQAQQDPTQIQDEARQAFAEHLGSEESSQGGMNDVFDDMSDDVDNAFDELSVPSIQKPDSDEENFESTMPDDGGVSFGGQPSKAVQPAPPQDTPDVTAGEPQTTLPDEENSMNGEMDSPEQTQWSSGARGNSSSADQYERIEEVGSGGIGTVYRGRQVRLKRDVAIKEIREIFNVFAGIQRSDILDRFQNIVEIQASLVHPNVIQLIDCDTSGEYPFWVMQFAPNGNLRRLLEHGDRPPLKVSLKYFLQLLHALNTAHDQDVVHGSLKPENVVLDHAGNAMVTDFGISKIVEQDGGTGNQVYVGVGSVAYMSPEQFQDPNLATVSTDIYSLGIMFYEMLTGKVPGRRSPMPSSFYPDIPRALDDIFDQMTMDTEEDRYDSIAEIIADLYASEDIMELFDKRSGVLFLRDPITHGELGLGEGVVIGAPQGDSSEASEQAAAATEEDSPEVDGDADEPEDAEEQLSDEQEEDEDKVVAEGSSDAPEGEAGDVLNKLDEYGEMFDDV